MKTIGLVGGTGWVSSVEYYRIINQEVNSRMGGLQFAKCILYSLNYGEIDILNQKNDRAGIFSIIRDAVDRVIRSGAECVLLCANTTHQFADELELQIRVPLIHIARTVAKEIKTRGYRKVGLMGTKQTMEMDFYKKTLQNENIEVLIPEKDDREYIQNTIDQELLKELILDKSKMKFHSIIDTLRLRGAQAVVLGCTEIPLLVKQADTNMPLINTLEIHARAAVDFALQ